MTAVNPLQRATVAGATTTAGHATTFAHQRKMRGAGEACRRQGITLIPVVVESLGGWGRGSQGGEEAGRGLGQVHRPGGEGRAAPPVG